jgi:H+/Cl- antiporter ClcA
LSNLFSRGAFHLFDPDVLAIFAVVYLLLSLSVYELLLPTDLVAPNLIFGATLGRLYGVFVNYLKAQMGSPPIDPGAYALIGAAAFWSGTARITVTIAVITIESPLI